MDFTAPLQALVPGATGQILGVLIETSTPLSGRAIAALANVSPAQAGRTLHRLAELGVVEANPAPPAVLYALVPDHLVVEPLRALSGVQAGFVRRLGEAVAALDPAPVCVGAFGSFARRQATASSDLDLLVVRPKAVVEDDDEWSTVLEQIRTTGTRLSGNPVEILEVGQGEVRTLLLGRDSVWCDIARDFLPIYGVPVTDL